MRKPDGMVLYLDDHLSEVNLMHFTENDFMRITQLIKYSRRINMERISVIPITFTSILLCLKQYTNLLSTLLFIMMISGCCSLPLVNCGPKIAPVKVNPEKLEIHCGDELRTLSFKGWHYLLKSNRNVVYLDVNSDGYDLNQSNFKLYFINQNDTTFLQHSIEEHSANDQVSRYEVSRDSVFNEISLYLEVLPNAAGCQLNKKNIQLLIDNL